MFGVPSTVQCAGYSLPTVAPGGNNLDQPPPEVIEVGDFSGTFVAVGITLRFGLPLCVCVCVCEPLSPVVVAHPTTLTGRRCSPNHSHRLSLLTLPLSPVVIGHPTILTAVPHPSVVSAW